MAYSAQINKGDVVWLKSGSPAMSVNDPSVNANKAACTWFENSQLKEGYFAHEALTKEKPEVDEILTREKYQTLVEHIETLNSHHKDLGRAFTTIDNRLTEMTKAINQIKSPITDEISKLRKQLEDQKIIKD